jgi:hypothetical protein
MSVSLGAGNSDNVARSATAGTSATLASAGFQISVLQQTRRLRADISGDLAYVNYSKRQFDSEFVGSFGTVIRIGGAEDILGFTFEENFGQTRQDSFTVPSPANRENVSYSSVGPDLHLTLGSGTRLLAQARYARVDYQSSPLKNQRRSGFIALERELSSSAILAVRIRNETIDPSDAMSPDYQSQQATLSYTLMGARTIISAEAGAGRVDGDGAKESGPVLRLAVARKFGRMATFSARAGREFTDSGNTLNQQGMRRLPPAQSSTLALPQTTQPYVSNSLRGDWRLEGARTALTFGAAWYRENFLNGNQLNRDRDQYSVEGSRQLGPRMSAHAGWNYTHNDFRNLVGDYSEDSANLGLRWQLGRLLSVDADVHRTRYSSDLTIFAATEHQFWVKLRYGTTITRPAAEFLEQ